MPTRLAQRSRAASVSYLYAFTLAWSLCSRVPLPRRAYPDRASAHLQSLSVLFYPLVGALLGILLWLVYASIPASAGTLFTAVTLVSVWALFTGGMHLDGLADSVDAHCASHKGGSVTLAVFKDPAAGPMAVIAIVIVLLIKVAAVAALIQQNNLLVPLFAALLISRWLIFAVMAFTPYVRPQGIAHEMTVKPWLPRWLVSSAIVAVVTAAVSPIIVFWLILAIAFAAYWRALWLRSIGGYVGDCLGALIEITEALILFLAVLTCC